MNIYLVMAIGGIIGIVLHVFVTMQTINKTTPQATFNTVWDQYWRTDVLSLFISILGFMAFLFIIGDWVDLNHLDSVDYRESAAERALHGKLSTFMKTTSLIFGYFADYLVYKFIGKTKQIIDKRIDGGDGK